MTTPNETQSGSAGSKPGWLGTAANWAGKGLYNAGSVLDNTMRGVGTATKGLANTAAGGIGTGLGAIGGGLATAGGYATDAMGLTQNAGNQNWAGTKAFVGTYGNAAANGIKDTFGGAADTLTGGAYDYDGSLFSPNATAVEQMRNQHVHQMGENSTASKIYGGINAVSDLAGEAAAYGGAGAGVRAMRGVPQASGAFAVSRPVATAPRAAMKEVAKRPYTAVGVGALTARSGAMDAADISAGKSGFSEQFPDASEEQLEQINSAGAQLSELPDDMKQQAGAALQNPEGSEATNLAQAGQRNFIDENMAQAPSDPNSFGSFMNQTVERFNAMPMEMKIGLGLGIGGGLMGLMGSLNNGGIGNFLMAALGLGGAGLVAANSGLLGDNAQHMLGTGIMNAGSALGFEMPQKQDLSQLMADDPFAESSNLGMLSDPDAINAAVAKADQSKQDLAALQAAPAWLRPSLLRAIDPENIQTAEDADRAAANAQRVYNTLNDPESDVSKKIESGRSWANSGWNPRTWGKTSSYSRALTKYAFNAMDAKEMHDLKHEQDKKYDLKNSRRLRQLEMRKEHDCTKLQPRVTGHVTVAVIKRAIASWA